MQRRSWSLRIALWAAVCAVLLQSAMPMLASVSARAQGKSLVEVCTVYGVSTVVLDAQGQPDSGPASEHGEAHAAHACTLNSLMALAAPQAPGPALQDVLRATSPPRVPACVEPSGPDACGAWVARLKHGPPARA